MKEKPKYVYVIIKTETRNMQILGCFYSISDARRYIGDSLAVDSSEVIIQKLAVFTQ